MTLNALHMVHDAYARVSTEAIVEIAELLELHPAEVLDTMSFYNFFHEAITRSVSSESGCAAVFRACCAAAKSCFKSLSEQLNVTAGQTTSDGKVTLEFAECLGACERHRAS